MRSRKRLSSTRIARRPTRSWARRKCSKGDPVAAEAAFRKAVEINPKSPLALVSLANFVWSKGDADQAEALLKRALEADPKSVVANRALAMFYLVRNKAAEAPSRT